MYTYRSDQSRMFGSDTIGIQSYDMEPDLLGSPDVHVTSLVANNEVFFGNVPAMFDRGLLEMVANDPHKGIFVPGKYNHEVADGQVIGEDLSGTVTADSKALAPAHLAAADPPDTDDRFVFTPLNSWKYWPQSVWMKFSQRIRRTFYNPGNVMMTVYVTELRRKRSQMATDVTGNIPTNTDSDTELLDILPAGELNRLWWQDISGGCLSYFAETCQGSAAFLLQIIRAGEYYRRFLYPRFGQFEQMQYQSRGFNNVSAINDAPVPAPPFRQLSRWDPRYSDPPGTAPSVPTNPQDPASHGYSFRQNIRDVVTTSSTIDGLSGASLDPYYTIAASGVDTKGQDYTHSMAFNPLKNPFLKKMFYMRRTKYVIPPGGSAVHVFRTSGNVNPIRSRLMRYMKFYQYPATSQEATQATREFPYCLPFSLLPTPNPYIHAARKSAGWTSVGCLTQVKGQMVMLTAPTVGTGTQMQFSQTRVVSHDRTEVRFRVCSYGRPVIGGATAHSSFLAASNTASDYHSRNPTAAPTLVNPVTGT